MKAIITSLALLVGLVAFGQDVKKKANIEERAMLPFSTEEDRVKHQAQQENTLRKDIVGTVVYKPGEKCELHIQVKEGEKILRFLPVNLSQGFMKNGLKLKFDYEDVYNVRLNASCGFDKAIKLSNIRLISAEKKELKERKSSTM